MERILVDTDKLKAHSKQFESSAAVFSQVGKDILSFAAGLPSYDGQLSTPARVAALEIHCQCRDVSGYYSSDAQSLAKTAQAFEAVDNQTAKLFGDHLSIINFSQLRFRSGGKVLNSLSPDIVVPQEGKKGILAYEEDENAVTLWVDGKQLIINKNDPRYLDWKTRIDDFRKAEQDFYIAAIEMLSTLHELINRAGLMLAALLLFPLISAITGGIEIVALLKTAFPELFAIIENPFFKSLFGEASGLLAVLSLKDYDDLTQKFEDAADRAKKAYENGEQIWDQLNKEFGAP
jgi:uncharacterized protein YukE